MRSDWLSYGVEERHVVHLLDVLESFGDETKNGMRAVQRLQLLAHRDVQLGGAQAGRSEKPDDALPRVLQLRKTHLVAGGRAQVRRKRESARMVGWWGCE